MVAISVVDVASMMVVVANTVVGETVVVVAGGARVLDVDALFPSLEHAAELNDMAQQIATMIDRRGTLIRRVCPTGHGARPG